MLDAVFSSFQPIPFLLLLIAAVTVLNNTSLQLSRTGWLAILHSASLRALSDCDSSVFSEKMSVSYVFHAAPH